LRPQLGRDALVIVTLDQDRRRDWHRSAGQRGVGTGDATDDLTGDRISRVGSGRRFRCWHQIPPATMGAQQCTHAITGMAARPIERRRPARVEIRCPPAQALHAEITGNVPGFHGLNRRADLARFTKFVDGLGRVDTLGTVVLRTPHLVVHAKIGRH
jgi:hypothetical protein